MRRSLLPVLALATAACSNAASPSETRETTATSSARLVGATANTGDPAVVVLSVSGAGECTAEFVSTTVLLTAAHCVLTEDAKPLTGATFRFSRVNDFATANDWVTIDPSDVHAHPQYTGNEHDIAVLVLKKAANVQPLPFITRPLTSAEVVGKSVRLIGYGATKGGNGADDGFGIKRKLTTTIGKLDTHFVELGKAGQTACGGDSGGPALLTIGGVETIVGVDSFSDAEPDCSASEFYQRVDTETAFIKQFVTTSSTGAPAPTAPAGNGTAPGAGDDDDDDTTSADTAKPKKKSESTEGDEDEDSSRKSKKGSAVEATAGCAIGPQRSYGGSSALALGVILGLAVARRRRR